MTAHADNARKITKNSFWYAVDSSGATLMMLVASVPVARILGPEVLGHYIFLMFITNVAQRLANVGIPATACKYMAEYMGRREPGIVREIYRVTLRHQAVVATVVTAIGCALVPVFAEPGFRLVSLAVVLSMWPSMVVNIPAQANAAAENLRANVPANWALIASHLLLVTLTLLFGWGLPGLAFATLASRTLEAVVRFRGVHRWIHDAPPAELPPDLRGRMITFSRQNLVLLVMGLVVWDRSELFFLQHYSPIQEVAFYSLAFSIANQLLMAPRAFSSAIGVSMLAQYGRNRAQLANLTQNATRYISLVAVPMFLGLAAVAEPLIRAAYGAKYVTVIPVLWILSVAAIPRAFQVHLETLLQATENQAFTVRWLTCSAVANVALDWLLIPSYGALGAAIANGAAQTLAVAGLWVKSHAVVTAEMPRRLLQRLLLSGAAMILVVVPLGRVFPPPIAIVSGVLIGVLAFGIAVRITGCLELEDWERFNELTNRTPVRFRQTCRRSLRLLIANVPG